MLSIKWLDKNRNGISISFKDLIYGKDHEYSIKSSSLECWPVQYYTATTDMRDWIGNVIAMDKDGTCQIEGVYRGCKTTMPKVKAMGEFKIGQRVMVTEHVSVNGRFEMIATTGRILDGDNNFVNVGFSDEKQAKVLRIDLYTGEYVEMIVGSVSK